MIVSLTIVRYPKIYIPVAVLAMALHRIPLLFNGKCSFWKLLGSGYGGTFSLRPDLQQWGLFAVWSSREDFESFYRRSLIKKWWSTFGSSSWTILCTPLSGHGKWDGKEPFVFDEDLKDYKGKIAVLTRATIRPSRLKNFWKNVDAVSRIMKSSPGYVMSVGVGEAPLYKQATFSLWESEEDMKKFAYSSKEHRDVIRKTREENWYSEELFARFKPVEIYESPAKNNNNI